MRTTITIINLAALLACLTLWAQEPACAAGGGLADRFNQLDKNGDGKIDDSERAALREFIRQRGQQKGMMTPSGKTETVGNREVTEMDYASSDGRKIPCVLSMPKGDGPFPCVVTIHGGQGNRDLQYLHTMAAPNKVSPTVSALNEQPWAILAISYRAGEGALFGMEQDDVVAGIRFAKTLPKIDPVRVGVIGGSHGGHLALRAAELMGTEFLCVVAGSPWMTDPFVYMTGKADQPPLSQVPAAAREQIIGFFTKQFDRRDLPNASDAAVTRPAASRPGPSSSASATTSPATMPVGSTRPTASQADAIRRLRSRLADMPVPENLTRRTLDVEGKDREFFMNTPPAAKGKPSPTIFVLHGGATSTGLAMHLKTDFTLLGEKEGYVTVYPSGVNGWNIGSHDAYSVKRRTSDADDVGFFRAMFDALIKKGVADPKQIYVVGGSNGGVMTQFLVCSLADRIAGAGVLVATLPRAADKEWPKPARPVPIVVMLGTEDPMKPWKGNADQMSAEETIAFWRKQNGCAEETKKWDLPDRDPNDGCRVHAQRWEGKAPVVFYTMEGHGHGWPMQRGRDETGTGPKTRDISAPEEFWKFFEKHPLDSSSAKPEERR